MLPLLGGGGEGQAAGAAGDHRFGQWIRFSHDGRGFLAYESRNWPLTDDGGVVGPACASSGFWRLRARTTSSWSSPVRRGHRRALRRHRADDDELELTTDVLARTPDAPDVTRAVRLYGIVDGALMYAIDRAGPDEAPRPWDVGRGSSGCAGVMARPGRATASPATATLPHEAERPTRAGRGPPNVPGNARDTSPR